MKFDLHTHSIASPDGGLTLKDYKKALTKVDVIAITDHNRIDFAVIAQEILGKSIIVGEEIMTKQGEIIGLFLNQVIEPGLPLDEAIRQIKRQGGLVYLPHPFETVRSGIAAEELADLAEQIDIAEVFNGRAVFQDKGAEAVAWAAQNDVLGVASSDAHGRAGWLRTFTSSSTSASVVGSDNLLELLAEPILSRHRVGLGIIYPKLNRFKKVFSR